MIVGVGIDVVDIGRFAETLERTPALAERVFTPDERKRSIPSQAARFAAKEALAKALGAPVGLQWHDAEVVRDDAGRPWFSVRGTVERRCAVLGVVKVHLSLSHDAGVASAMVVLEGDGTGIDPMGHRPGAATGLRETRPPDDERSVEGTTR
ncbi:holo-ACP synthase [Phytoactinopolyspora sp. XMNu-373]|uniref:Holo-[acyl-carrier-protein] synthase n=1 Tax=Phytoactinopolyspora mesophila TaxID=2650750 RepID=A0A7K3M2L3_9ACTN|nr:holo-ACP synthase [Phytoactinopolyspora mesophila]